MISTTKYGWRQMKRALRIGGLSGCRYVRVDQMMEGQFDWEVQSNINIHFCEQVP